MSNFWQSARVRLRALEPSDAHAFFEWNLDTEMARHLYEIPFPQSRESVARWAQEASVRPPHEDDYIWVIETLDGTIVGTFRTHHCDRHNGNFKYGFAIMQEHQRKGYASEAIKLVLRYFFEELGYHKVNAEVYSFNDASIALHERMGFRPEGRLRHMIYTKGKHWDMLVYGMKLEEFQARL